MGLDVERLDIDLEITLQFRPHQNRRSQRVGRWEGDFFTVQGFRTGEGAVPADHDNALKLAAAVSHQGDVFFTLRGLKDLIGVHIGEIELAEIDGSLESRNIQRAGHDKGMSRAAAQFFQDRQPDRRQFPGLELRDGAGTVGFGKTPRRRQRKGGEKYYPQEPHKASLLNFRSY